MGKFTGVLLRRHGVFSRSHPDSHGHHDFDANADCDGDAEAHGNPDSGANADGDTDLGANSHPHVNSAEWHADFELLRHPGDLWLP